MGAQLAQGFLLTAPLPASELDIWFDARAQPLAPQPGPC